MISKRSLHGDTFPFQYLMVFRLSLGMLLFFCVVRPATAQMWIGNQFVAASVESTEGLITIYEGPVAVAQSKNGVYLSYNGHSYLNLKVNTEYYTNNIYPADIGHVHLLSAPFNSKVADTIFSTWTNVEGLTIIQKVYPVLFSKSSQIVISINAVDPKGGQDATVQAQYLLDTDPANDAADVLTRYGYNTNWIQYPGGGNGIPWFYIAFEYNLPNPPTFSPGISGEGLLTYAPLGLMTPDKVIIGNWPDLSTPAWVTSSGTGTFKDSGVLIEWGPQTVISNDDTTQIGRTSYGTGQFYLCVGNILAISFYPDNLQYSPKPVPKYSPDPFVLESYMFNTSSLTSVSVGENFTLTTGPYLTIDTPATNQSNGGHVQTQTLSDPIAPQSVAVFDWLVNAGLYQSCSGDTTTWMQLTGTTNLGPPTFLGQCLLPETLPSASIDNADPLVDRYDTLWQVPSTKELTDSLQVNVHDDRCTDLGLQSITYNFVGANASAFNVTYSKNYQQGSCEKDTVTVTVQQIDSTQAGCFDFTFTDCAGNISTTSLCFVAHPVPGHPDVKPPTFTLLALVDTANSSPCSAELDSILVADDSMYDTGLDSLWVVSATNMKLNGPNTAIAPHLPSTLCSVSVIDSLQNGTITLAAKDVKGNTADTTFTYCTTPDTRSPHVVILTQSRTTWMVHVWDDSAWDRGIDSIIVTGNGNYAPNPANANGNVLWAQGTHDTTFTETITDTTKAADFCVQAFDFAGNKSPLDCVSDTTTPDSWPPNIVLTPLGPNPNNPSAMYVNVNDIHFINGQKIGWDKGIQKVWFTNVSGMDTATGVTGGFACIDSTPSFQFNVHDTLADGVQACITINALDCAGNFHDTTWCYAYPQDTTGPVISALATDRNTFSVKVSDMGPHTRGLDSLLLHGMTQNTLYNASNLAFVNGTPAIVGQNSWSGNVQVVTPGKSAQGILQATNLWSIYESSPHDTSRVELHSWVQNYKLRTSNLYQSDALPSPGVIDVPIQFVQTDTFGLSRKQISQFQFTFSLSYATADQGIIFKGINTAGTQSRSWTVNPPTAAGTNAWTVTGTAPANSWLSDADTAMPLINLEFNAPTDAATREAVITIAGDSIVYNNNQTTTLNGPTYAQAVLLAPYGQLTGTTIVVTGTCAPTMGSNVSPTINSIDPVFPNPSSGSSTISYTVAQPGLVSLTVFDALGREMSRLVSQVQKPGYYQVGFNSTILSPGTYFARLETPGGVYTRALIIAH